MNYAIETDNVSKSFGSVHAVDNVSLRVDRGEIYAFLGLNGAGKTTTIRMLLGMIRPSAGNVKVLGQFIGHQGNGSGPWAQVGHLVESPSNYPELTVRENLEIARRLQGVKNPKATDEVMDQLVLASYADRKSGTLSLGNLQRLGLARALLHHPELIILDEPANGLDPAGIVEIRKLLASLAHEHGATIFMSSHILTEVDKLADRIGIVHKGRLIEELDADRLEAMRSLQLTIRTRDLVKAQEVLTSRQYKTATIDDSRLIVKDREAVDSPELIATILVQAGTPPTHLAVEQENLEEYFLRLTKMDGSKS
jgi:ABC-2 type transport system ATP-binding protein